MDSDILQTTTHKNKEVTPQSDLTNHLTTNSTQQDFLQQTKEQELHKENNIVAQFSKNVPLHSIELEKRLQDGPPPELGKFQKIQWSSEMNQKIKDAKKNEQTFLKNQHRFFAPAYNLLGNMVRTNQKLPENATLEQVITAFTDCMTTAQNIDTQKLITDPSELPKEVNSLKKLFTELSSFTPQTFTQEQAKDYSARYHALGMEVNAATSRYLDEAGTMNPASCYMILYHSVTLMLQHHLNLMGTDKVDATEFSKLYALSTASGFAVNAMTLNQDYQNCRKNHLEELSIKAIKEKERQNREFIVASRKQYLYRGTGTNDTASSWPLAPYAKLAETILGEKLFLLSDKELGLAIQRMEENLENNTTAVNIFYRNKIKQNPVLAVLQEQATSEILQNIGESILTIQLAPTADVLIDAMTKFTTNHSEEFELYETRIQRLKGMPPLDLLAEKLLHTEITNMIFSYKNDEDFNAAAIKLQEQSQKNIDIVNKLIAQKVTPKNQNDALISFINRNGHMILFSAPAVLFIETEYFLEYLHQFAPNVAYAENNLREKILDAGIDSCWILAVSKHLSDSNISLDEDTEELKKLKEYIDANKNTFDEKTLNLKRSSAQWQMILQWLEENIIQSANDFTQSLSTFLLKDELQLEGDLTKTEYENKQPNTSPSFLTKDTISNVNRLRGEDLCHWSGFDGFLTNEEDAVMDALEQALQDKHLPMKALEIVHTLDDLELLPLQEFSTFLTLVRSNVAKALSEWKNISGLHPQKVRIRLLKDLICGNLTKENIGVRAAEEEALIVKQLNAEKLRFLSFMGGNAPVAGEIRYLHLKETASTALSGDASRAVRRKERFRIANSIWNNIRTENLENVIHKYWLNAQGQTAPIAYILKSLKETRNTLHSQTKEKSISPMELDELNKKIQTLDRLIDLLKPAQTNNCEREFMLRGMEDELLSFTKAGDSFTSHNLEEYNKTLLELEKFAIPRYEELNKTLKKIFGSNSDQITIYYNKAKKMLAGLEPLDGSAPTEEQQQANRARFGVSCWDEALQEISKLAIPQNDAIRLEADNATALLNKRTEQIKKYKGGILKPFHSLILQNQEAFQTLMTMEEEGVAQYLSILEQQFHNPYEALRRYHPEGTFAQEFIIEKQELFWDKKNNSLEFWKKQTENYYNAYSEFEIKGVSISSRYREISENMQALEPYLMQIIFADTEGISILLNPNKKELYGKLEAFEKRITANNTSMESFLNEPANTVTPILRTGFIQYLQTKIPFMESEDFKTKLPLWWKDFQVFDDLTQDEVQKSIQIMNERSQIMLQIESKKQRGIEADRNTQTSLKNIQNQVKYATSPIMLALGQSQVLNKKEFSKHQKYIQTEYSNMPNIIQDILLESSLLKTNSKQLVQEAAWLNATYEKIITVSFPIGETSIHIDGDIANELLMVTFTKLKAGKKTDMDNPDTTLTEITENELRDNLLELADSHRKLQELSELEINDAGLLMERDHLLETLAAGMYSMPKADFDDLITKRTSYIKASNMALAMFYKATADFGNEQIAICSGLREYFHEDLLKGEGALNILTLREQTENQLKDTHIRQFLKTSNSLLEQVSNTDEVKVTVSHHTLDQKHDLESYLESLSDKSIFKSYAKLNLAEQQMFAIALGAPGQEEIQLPTAGFLKNENLETATRIQIQNQLHQYINHDKFTPIVDYTKALSQLKNPDGTINKEAFQRAMDFTSAITYKRLQQLPIDWNRLSDSVSTYTAAKRIMGQTVDSHQFSVKNSEEFLQRLTTTDMGEAQKTKNELQSLTQHQLQLLIHALTDRTILDRTTRITAWDRAKGVLHEYANKEKREELKNLLIQDFSIATQNTLSSQALSAAMASLMSYQLRDDITLTGRSINKNDFADGALARKTVIDWSLLSEALSFVREVEQESLRLNAISQADVLIMESKNTAAIEEYKIRQKSNLSTQEDFEAYLQTQAQKDGKAALYAGYLQLNKQERALFIKALTKRHLLDISKNNIHLNRLGLASREYADEQSRNLLLDEYMKSMLTQGSTIELDENSYRQAVYMTLSTQLSDDVDFSQIKDTSLANYLTSFSNPFKSVRNTAVDWKLVQRALQFVHRASNESDIFRQDRELYVSQGNLLNTGRFTFDATHLRKNIHNSGSRFGRYLYRRVQDNLLDQIPAYLKPLLGQAIRLVRANLSAEHADQVTKLGIFDDDEDSSLIEKASTLLEWEDSFYKDFFKDISQKNLGKEAEKNFRDKMETAADHLTYLNAANTTGEVIRNFYQLNFAKLNAADASFEDIKQTEEAAIYQTEQQQELSNKAIARNFNLQKQGRTKATERQMDTIIDTITEVITTAAIDDDLLEIVVTESGKLINFIRNYINDKSSVVKFFNTNGELEKLRSTYNDMTWDSPKEELSDIDLICQMKGYENYTELADFVGINISHSLLFCASKYNPQKHLYYLAVATLATIDMADAIGSQDGETAEKVFNALMGADYR